MFYSPPFFVFLFKQLCTFAAKLLKTMGSVPMGDSKY